MAKQLGECYPMLRDNSVNCKHTWHIHLRVTRKHCINCDLRQNKKQCIIFGGRNSPAEIVGDLGVHFGPDSQQSQARHYRTLQEMLKRPKPNKEAVAQQLDLEFDARRAFINSDNLRDQDRPANILQAYPVSKEEIMLWMNFAVSLA
ncbi:hypothetical protein SRHO_G00229970 [Serrasalmus rhombeus]